MDKNHSFDIGNETVQIPNTVEKVTIYDLANSKKAVIFHFQKGVITTEITRCITLFKENFKSEEACILFFESTPKDMTNFISAISSTIRDSQFPFVAILKDPTLYTQLSTSFGIIFKTQRTKDPKRILFQSNSIDSAVKTLVKEYKTSEQ